jgi:chloramphenicol 3-O-phosphotransferase
MQEYEIPLWIESTLDSVYMKIGSCDATESNVNYENDMKRENVFKACLKHCQKYFSECNEWIIGICLSLNIFVRNEKEIDHRYDSYLSTRFSQTHRQSVEVVTHLYQFQEVKKKAYALVASAVQQCKDCIESMCS